MDSAADTFILKLIMLSVQTAEEWIEVEGKRGFTSPLWVCKQWSVRLMQALLTKLVLSSQMLQLIQPTFQNIESLVGTLYSVRVLYPFCSLWPIFHIVLRSLSLLTGTQGQLWFHILKHFAKHVGRVQFQVCSLCH